MKVVGKFGTEERPMAMLDMGDGSHIELIGLKNDASTREEMPVAEPGLENPILHLALTTTDTRAAVELVRQAGFKITIEPRDVDLGELKVTIAFFKGPNGELIEFFQTY
jgi:glyoxylase I family protein